MSTKKQDQLKNLADWIGEKGEIYVDIPEEHVETVLKLFKCYKNGALAESSLRIDFPQYPFTSPVVLHYLGTFCYRYNRYSPDAKKYYELAAESNEPYALFNAGWVNQDTKSKTITMNYWMRAVNQITNASDIVSNKSFRLSLERLNYMDDVIACKTAEIRKCHKRLARLKIGISAMFLSQYYFRNGKYRQMVKYMLCFPLECSMGRHPTKSGEMLKIFMNAYVNIQKTKQKLDQIIVKLDEQVW